LWLRWVRDLLCGKKRLKAIFISSFKILSPDFEKPGFLKKPGFSCTKTGFMIKSPRNLLTNLINKIRLDGDIFAAQVIGYGLFESWHGFY
jgi:hypothetical protein